MRLFRVDLCGCCVGHVVVVGYICLIDMSGVSGGWLIVQYIGFSAVYEFN